MLRFVVLLISFVSLYMETLAGDLIDRLGQFSNESLALEFHSVVHFDLVSYEQSDSSSSQVRYLGRQVNGGNGRRRLDFVKMTTTGRGESRVWEHYLELSPKERYYTFQLDGGKLQNIKIISLDGKNSIRPSIGPVNPFNFAFGGGQELGRFVGTPVEKVISRFEDFPKSNSFVRNKGGNASIVWDLQFDSKVPWQVTRTKVYRSSKGCDEENPSNWKDKTEKLITENWHLSKDVHSKWKEIEGEAVPIYVHSFSQYFDCNDESATEDFEAVFFDFQFDNLEVDRFFDKDRLTEVFLREDFSVDKLEKQSKSARMQLN